MEKRSRLMQSFTLLFGILLAVTVVCAQFFQVSGNLDDQNKGIQTEETEHGSDAQSFISLPSFSLPTPVHVQVAFDSYCLFEILLTKDKSENVFIEQPLSYSRFFTTLFRVIIAPNAP